MVFGVTVPFKGSISVLIEARTEDEAVEKALEIANLDGMDGCSIDDCVFEDDVDIEYDIEPEFGEVGFLNLSVADVF